MAKVATIWDLAPSGAERRAVEERFEVRFGERIGASEAGGKGARGERARCHRELILSRDGAVGVTSAAGPARWYTSILTETANAVDEAQVFQ